MFETLLNYGEQDTTLKEGLAVKWDASDDGLTYTLELRQGVKFHDGTDFNAEAVKYNFERWMNGDEEKFPYYGMFGGYKKDEGHVIKDIKVLDDHKIQFILKRPQAPFLKNLAMTSFGIASPAAIEKYGEKFRSTPSARALTNLSNGSRTTGSFLKKMKTIGIKVNQNWRRSFSEPFLKTQPA